MDEEEDDIPFLSDASKVSGNSGLEKFKFKLIKLINQTGATYVGTEQINNTSGRKYRMAKDIGIVVVNHRLFEECLKEGKHFPEAPYVMHSFYLSLSHSLAQRHAQA